MASSNQPKDTEKRKVWDKLYRDNNKEKINEYAKNIIMNIKIKYLKKYNVNVEVFIDEIRNQDI